MTNKLWIDPPSGWRYGFPKIWDPQQEPDIKTWLIESGYPADQVNAGLNYYRQWAVDAPEVDPETPTIGEELNQKRSVFESLDSMRDVFKQWEDDFVAERLTF